MSTPATTLPIEPGDAGHQHLCRRDHYWQHAGPTAEGCALPTPQPHTALLSEADCAVCAGRDDLLTRPRHSHRCTFCEVQWIHEGRCAEGLAAWCPWDFAGSSGETAPGTRIGRHLHHCPNCGTHWAHLEPCAAQWRVALSSCPGCGTPPQRSAGRLRLEAWQASRGPGAACRHRNSAEFAPPSPATCRANSITAHWRPRQMPRNGTLGSGSGRRSRRDHSRDPRVPADQLGRLVGSRTATSNSGRASPIRRAGDQRVASGRAGTAREPAGVGPGRGTPRGGGDRRQRGAWRSRGEVSRSTAGDA